MRCLRGVPGHPVWVSRGGPQDRDQLRTVEQTADHAPLVQILDPVEPWDVQLPSVVRFFLTRCPVSNEQVKDNVASEQVLDVPKISLDWTRQRLGDSLRHPQRAEQLVEVLTIVSFSSLQEIVEQNADIPVPPGRGAQLVEVVVFEVFFQDRVTLCLLSRSSTIQFLVSVVVLVEVFTVYTQDRVLQRLVKQILVFQQRLRSKTLTFQFCVVRLTIFIKLLFLQLVLLICRIRKIKGFSALFPVGKSAKIPAHPGVGTGRGLQLMTSVSLAGGVAG